MVSLEVLQFVDDEGKPEREELSARSLRLRPAWPASASPASLSVYQVRSMADPRHTC